MLSYEALVADSEPVEDAYRHGDDLAGIFYTGGDHGLSEGRDAEPHEPGFVGLQPADDRAPSTSRS